MVVSLAAVIALAACAGQPAAGGPGAPTTGPSARPTATSFQVIAPAAQPTAAAVHPSAQATDSPASSTAAATTAATATPAAQAQATTAAPACTSPGALTPAVTEGPYFKAGSPERASLLTPGLTGVKLVLTGYVLTADCKPVANALLDFWQADANGSYDNSGYTLRGHQYTDASGRYQLTTIIPGLYPGRTEHIHVKVQAPNRPVLTSQLFFPGVVGNSTDGIYNPKLLIDMQKSTDGYTGTYTFVVAGG